MAELTVVRLLQDPLGEPVAEGGRGDLVRVSKEVLRAVRGDRKARRLVGCDGRSRCLRPNGPARIGGADAAR
jgi:hypothetical protein